MDDQMNAENFSNLVAFLTGSGGAIVFAWLWIKSLKEEKTEIIQAFRAKDKELSEITREAIHCIESVLNKTETDKEWNSRLEALMRRIEQRLDKDDQTPKIFEEP